MRYFRFIGGAIRVGLVLTLLTASPLLQRTANAQAISTNGGSIQGSIADGTGAAIPGATITVAAPATGFTRTLTTDKAGYYSIGPLIPGEYTITVIANGFQREVIKTVVKVGTATSGNAKLTIGNQSETVQVIAGSVQVDTEQSSVSNVLTREQIESLPINGRNFLDLAQLEPGVQLQSGDSFDPTKAGYSAISFSGISGRTTRILLDGQDITDETVGTTIVNVSEGAIDQFQINRSNSDVSGEIGSSGQVFVSTQTGTNALHGELFGNFQDHRAGFAEVEGIDAPFQRNQFGGNLGGPILRDKLFFFANSERIKQDESSSIQLDPLFSGIQSKYPNIPAPYRSTYSTGRVDYDGPWGVHYFSRLSYDVDAAVTDDGAGYANYANRDNTVAIAEGADFVKGRFTHSIRTSYEKFHNLISDASGAGVYQAVPGLLIRYASKGLYTGPNDLAPQDTFQSDKQLRYDGSWLKGKHNIRYGLTLNRIQQGGFASFFGLAPRVSLNTSAWIGSGSEPISGLGPQDLLNDYSAHVGVRFGNGLGYYTNTPGFGAPAGGMSDWRTGLYIADSWKIFPRLTINAGLRYQRDTGRTDNALDPIPCSAINLSNFPTPPCSGSQLILDQFGAGLGARVHQPNFDFGPQLGFAYSLDSAGKTVLRGAIGVFRENNVFNAVQFDTPFKLQSGLFNDYSHTLCGGVYSISIPGVGSVSTYNGESIKNICAEPLATSGVKFAAIQKEYQAGAKKAGAAANGSFIGNRLSIPDGDSAFAPNYKTPYSIHVNVGVQHQIATGTILTADYIHQVTLHVAQTIDVNHVGDASYLNTDAAKAAVAATYSEYGVSDFDGAIAAGATLSDFAGNGLDSGNVYLNRYPAAYYGLDPAGGAAFPGKNANVGNGFFAFPAGRSAYDALQLNLREQKSHPLRGIAKSNLEVSYAYSRFVSTSSTGSDQFFGSSAMDYDQPTKYIGYGDLDHRHNLSFGGAATIARGPQIALIAHFLSSKPTNLILDDLAGSTGQIFISDVTGDGTLADLLPGTKPGAYGRGIHGHDLAKVIKNYNSTYAGQLTPAGKAVANAGILTAAQLATLGAVQQPIAAAPNKPFENPPFRSLDASLSYPVKLKFLSDKARLEPVISFYNVGNLGNFSDPSGVLLNTSDAGSSNYVNGPYNFLVKNENRTTRGSGTFDQGGPRSTEFSLKLEF